MRLQSHRRLHNSSETPVAADCEEQARGSRGEGSAAGGGAKRPASAEDATGNSPKPLQPLYLVAVCLDHVRVPLNPFAAKRVLSEVGLGLRVTKSGGAEEARTGFSVPVAGAAKKGGGRGGEGGGGVLPKEAGREKGARWFAS